MAKRPTEQQSYSWNIYRLRGTPAQLIGIVHNQPDEQAPIKFAIEEFKIPQNQRNKSLGAGLSDQASVTRLPNFQPSSVHSASRLPLARTELLDDAGSS